MLAIEQQQRARRPEAAERNLSLRLGVVNGRQQEGDAQPDW
jgi:hypothetical protein